MSHGVKISNLPHSVTEHSIREFLSKTYADLKQISIKGSSAKVFLEDEDEVGSVLMLDGTEFDGSTVLIEKIEGSSKSSSNKGKSKSSSDSESKKKKSKDKRSKEKVSEPEILATDVSQTSFVPAYEVPAPVNEAEEERQREEEKRLRKEARRKRRSEREAQEKALLLESNAEKVSVEEIEDNLKKEKSHRKQEEEEKLQEPEFIENKPEIKEVHLAEEIKRIEHPEPRIQSDESKEFVDISKKKTKKEKHEEIHVLENSYEIIEPPKHEIVEPIKHVVVESSKHDIVEPDKHEKISHKIETHEKPHIEEKSVSHQHPGHSEKKSPKIESTDELKKVLHGVSLHSRSHLPHNDSFKFVTEYNTATFIVLLALIVLTFSDLVN